MYIAEKFRNLQVICSWLSLCYEHLAIALGRLCEGHYLMTGLCLCRN